MAGPSSGVEESQATQSQILCAEPMTTGKRMPDNSSGAAPKKTRSSKAERPMTKADIVLMDMDITTATIDIGIPVSVRAAIKANFSRVCNAVVSAKGVVPLSPDGTMNVDELLVNHFGIPKDLPARMRNWKYNRHIHYYVAKISYDHKEQVKKNGTTLMVLDYYHFFA